MTRPRYGIRAFTDIEPGDHLCCIYETEEEYRGVLIPYVRQGLERGEKVLHIVDDHAPDALLTYLRKDGMDLDRCRKLGQLSILTVHETYLRDGLFDPDRMIALLRNETERALADGFSALRASGEMTWALREAPGSDRLIEYEAKLNTFFPGSKCLGLCQYPRHRFPPSVLLNILRTHPVAILGEKTCPNIYCEPANLVLAQSSVEQRVDWMIAELLQTQAAEESLDARTRQFDAARVVMNEIARELDILKVLDLIHRRAAELVGADSGSVWLWDDANQVLAPAAWHGLGEWMREHRLRLGEGILGLVAQSRRGIIINDYRGSPYAVPLVLEKSAITAALAEPLVYGDRLLGGIVINDAGKGRKFAEEDRQTLQLFAAQAAIAIENARLYEELREALQRVEASQQRIIQTERLRALGEMASGVSHDFNNILSIILGRSQLLLTQTRDPAARRQLEVIKTAAMDGARSVQRILEFSRVRPAKPFESVHLNQVIQDVIEITRPRWKDEAQAKGLRYDVRAESTPLPLVNGDPSELREALTNLVLNALDAMPAGGRLTFQTGVKGPRVYCELADTGVGMPEEVRQRVLDPYFTTKEEGGSGLGLSVVYGIISRHGGEIEVQSQVGKGSAFRIWLPVGREIPVVREEVRVSPSSRRAKILVIDDEPGVQELLRDLLSAEGHTVVTCADGSSGLARFQNGRYDLVLTDLAMPGISGWDVARAIKSQSPQTPVIMITGYGDRVDPAEARIKGVEYLITKPFQVEYVQELVALALSCQERREPATKGKRSKESAKR